jgi:hypothetical protein
MPRQSKTGGVKATPERIPASQVLRRAYAIHAPMAMTSGKEVLLLILDDLEKACYTIQDQQYADQHIEEPDKEYRDRGLYQ